MGLKVFLLGLLMFLVLLMLLKSLLALEALAACLALISNLRKGTLIRKDHLLFLLLEEFFGDGSKISNSSLGIIYMEFSC